MPDQVAEKGPIRFTEEEVQGMLKESARIGAQEALVQYKNKKRDNDDNDDDDSDNVVNPKIVKQLKDTVAVFTALKDLSSNPLQKTIEETVGVQAQNVVQSAFARPQYQNRDIVDTILNSQFAYGLGSGIGNRGPELVETLGRTFGNEKTYNLLSDVVKGYGNSQSDRRQPGTGYEVARSATVVEGQNQNQRQETKNVTLAPAPIHTPAPAPAPAPTPAPKEEKRNYKEERDLLLSLDPKNDEHIAAYADTQGGIDIESAKKMIQVHQEGFKITLRNEGVEPEEYIKKLRNINNNDNEERERVIHPIPKNNNIKPIYKKVEEVETK